MFLREKLILSEDSAYESDTIHLGDLLDNKDISFIYVYDNINDAHLSSNELLEKDEDGSSISSKELDVLDYTDEQIKELSRDKIKSFTNIELLDRIATLDKTKLTDEQIDLLKNYYKKKIIIDKEDVEKLISKFKECKRLSFANLDENQSFILENDLYDSDCLEIIKNLKVSDYYANTRDYDYKFFGNKLIIFEPKDVVLSSGKKLGDIVIYIKLDLNRTSNDVVAIVSFHKALGRNKLPYEESIQRLKEKLILNEDNVYEKSLRDIISNVDYFVVCDDINNTHFQEDTLDEEWDESNTLIYLQMTDKQLEELTEEEIHKIDNIELLDRLIKLVPSKLSAEQTEKILNIYKQKVIISKNDVEYLLDKFKECDEIDKEFHKKTNNYLKEHNITLEDCLYVIHNLKVSDYCANTKSININHIGNNLIVFEPKNVTLRDGRELGDVVIYIKLDVDESNGNTIAMVSFHEALRRNKLPYGESMQRLKEKLILNEDDVIEEDVPITKDKVDDMKFTEYLDDCLKDEKFRELWLKDNPNWKLNESDIGEEPIVDEEVENNAIISTINDLLANEFISINDYNSVIATLSEMNLDESILDSIKSAIEDKNIIIGKLTSILNNLGVSFEDESGEFITEVE